MYHTVIIHRPIQITSHFYKAVICLIKVNIVSYVSPKTIWII